MSKASSAHKPGPVSLVEGANVVMPPSSPEVLEQQAADTQNEQAEKFEKAIIAALPEATRFVEARAKFYAWLEQDKEVREAAHTRAKELAFKSANQDIDSEESKLEAQLAEIRKRKERNAEAFGLVVAAPVKPGYTGAKRGRKARGSAPSVNESDVLAALSADPQSINTIAEALSLSETKVLATVLKKLVAEKKVGTEGQRRGLKYLLA